MVLEPYFYVIAIVSVFLHGMGKGGFIGAGSFGSLLAIPMLSIFGTWLFGGSLLTLRVMSCLKVLGCHFRQFDDILS